MTGFYQQTTDYNQFHIVGGTFTGFRLECWACDTVLPWEEEHGCLELGEMVRIADAHWPVHAGSPIPPLPSAPDVKYTGLVTFPPKPEELEFSYSIDPVVHDQILRPSGPQFTGCLAYLADYQPTR
ncbi:hypothetical protein ABZW30_12520 [Kitasatospora sp. NPDC004669]|uniref:hypothetical protein n=1 Tax=Kitasatospora sp. NPDC004669 TaxID=3154555 RepID=UPI0033A8CB88